MTKRKTLDQWKEELVGKQFGRLIVMDVQPHIRKSTGRKGGFEAICTCICGKQKIVVLSNLFSGDVSSCGCFKKETVRNNIKGAHLWRENHPEEALSISNKNLEKANLWHKEHPEESKNLKNIAVYIMLKKNGPSIQKSSLLRRRVSFMAFYYL